MAVDHWVKAKGKNLAPIKRPAAQIVKLDELHSYVGHKKTSVGSGLLLLDVEKASSILSLSPEGSHMGCTRVMTDDWNPSGHFLPPEKRIHGKA